MKPWTIGALLGAALVLPLLGIINLLHELIGHTYVPVELIHSGLGLVLMDAVLFAEPLFLSLPLLAWGMGLCVMSYRRLHRLARRPMLLHGLGIGLLFGLPLLLTLFPLAESWQEMLMGLGILGPIFALWGIVYIMVARQVLIHSSRLDAGHSDTSHSNTGRALLFNPERRWFLWRGISATILVTGVMAGLAGMLHRNRRQQLAAQMRLPGHIPARLIARIFPTVTTHQATSAQVTSPQVTRPEGDSPFPELTRSRYQPSRHPIGVAFSGGGPRAMSCALGQMRGLYTANLLPHIGAISCLSGGAWFGTLFTYAPRTISDESLLGSVLAPEELRVETLTTIDPAVVAAPLTSMTNDQLLRDARDILRSMSVTDSQFNRFWSRLLNQSLLKPFGLDDYHRFFTLDAAAVTEISRRNPQLTSELFYTARPDRPYLICSATHIFPPGPDKVFRHFSFSPLYAGMQQYFPNSGLDNTDLGGGFIESFAFDSQTPLNVSKTDLVTVTTPEPLFSLSDMIGATSAAPGLLLSHYRQPHFMPQFHLWPVGEQGQSGVYSIVDGSGIDNSGIVPLLQRQYPIILVFVNAAIPLGDPGVAAVRGVSSEISRLFGLIPEANPGRNEQSIQIFPTEQFAPLADGLQAAQAAGGTAIFTDRYKLLQPNPFEILPYPNDEEVTVVWFYNERNESWYQRLPADVQTLLARTDPTNRMDNFPHFATAGQNQTTAGVPQALYYSPEQVNLLAHMWSHNLIHDGAAMIRALL